MFTPFSNLYAKREAIIKKLTIIMITICLMKEIRKKEWIRPSGT